MFVVIFYLNFWPGQNGRRHTHDILVTVSFVDTRLDNGFSPKRWQAIFQTNIDLQKIVSLETNVIHDSNPKHQIFYGRNTFENSIYETTAIVQ